MNTADEVDPDEKNLTTLNSLPIGKEPPDGENPRFADSLRMTRQKHAPWFVMLNEH